MSTLQLAESSGRGSTVLCQANTEQCTHAEKELQERPVVRVAHHGSINTFTVILLLHVKCMEKSVRLLMTQDTQPLLNVTTEPP